MARSSRTTSTSSEEREHGGRRIRRIRIAYGSALGGRELIVLERAPVMVGREDGQGDLALADREVSRQHVRFEFDVAQDAWFAEDLGSRNGTYVNGERCERALLGDGAVIRVGKSLLLFIENELRGSELLEPEAAPLYGPSLAMQRVRAEISLAAPRAIPVLILGETGVGKELVAEQIHAKSGRKGRFVPVNCAAIPAALAESELFGHQAGAFTGASQRTQGLFASAEGGTLFLDEIGELPLALQPKLLRALATGETRAVGSSETRRVDVRIVAATHRDLSGQEQSGDFRADLLARLSGFSLRVPPLRSRREDILPLATRFLGREPGGPIPSPDAAEALLLHAYPYNVRELEQAIAVAVVRRAGEGAILREHLPDPIALRVPPRVKDREPIIPKASVSAPSRGSMPTAGELRSALETCGGNIARVAELFGKDRHQVYRWARRFGIDLKTFRP